ncbi:hypothetical protein ACFSKI_14460 [Pseudogracilibacillus auburnensis]|uniref:Alpha/beta hydrolase family protein n=1 Tax=Pseudogracilibacillus auburnensis TaxID=1494959 RepID=A0A2V3WCA6_9BACI|nr:hypothetical protein [Pseudogracilibacillus auburnensis]PXW90681.1 hypothetical protein DFR56_101595 [Pseudogracilibacillus auburnensis]
MRTIGLDMAIPAAYENYHIQMPVVRLLAFAAQTGVIRWIPSAVESDAAKHGTLTEEEQQLYKIISYRRTFTKNMINEVKMIKENAKKVEENNTPNVPMLLFSSNGKGTGMDEDTWERLQREFSMEQENSILIELDASHYLHTIEFEKIAEEIEEFIGNLR